MTATKGEYAGWQGRAPTGDFDLRIFVIRAYPVEKIDGLVAWRAVNSREELIRCSVD